MDGLIEGRMVHYVLNKDDVETILRRRSAQGNAVCNNPNEGSHYASVVVRVFPEEYHGQPGVNLQVFLDGYDSHWVCSRRYSEDKEPGTWHWIEKA